jgi:hypothetical protein
MNTSPLSLTRVLTTAVLLAAMAAFGAARLDAAADPKAALATLKSLAGSWTGTAGSGEHVGPATVIYRITAGGHVVQETLFPGTAHEMVTMYHLDGDRLLATHYCAMGNQPRFVLSADSSSDTLVFDFESITHAESPAAMHMHGGRIHQIDATRLEAVWVVFKDGAKVGENRFTLQRQ